MDSNTGKVTRILSPRQEATCKWASDLVARGEFVVLDTETTGLETDDGICDLAIIGADRRVLFNQMVNPGRRISESARLVHGISDEEVARAASLALWWPRVYEILRSVKTIVTYNAKFDLRMLRQSLRAVGIRLLAGKNLAPASFESQGLAVLLEVEWQCLMEKYAYGFGERRTSSFKRGHVSLETACKRHVVMPDSYQWHRALGDALAAYDLLKRLAEMYDEHIRGQQDYGIVDL